jgi:hypothetical protein
MNLDRAIFLVAAVVILGSLALGYFVSAWFYLLTAFVGLNLLQAAFTGTCPASVILKRIGCPVGPALR